MGRGSQLAAWPVPAPIPPLSLLRGRGRPLNPAIRTCWGPTSYDALAVASPLVLAWAGRTLNSGTLGSLCSHGPPRCHF